jgi:hypothetical protein
MENPNSQVPVNDELLQIAVSCKKGKSCVDPPNDAPLYAVIRIQNGAPKRCVLRPAVATWFSPCYYRDGIKVSCDRFRDIIELFLKKYGDYSDGAVLYSIYCREFGLRWYAIFDDPWDGYCKDVATVDVLDDCIYL